MPLAVALTEGLGLTLAPATKALVTQLNALTAYGECADRQELSDRILVALADGAA